MAANAYDSRRSERTIPGSTTVDTTTMLTGGVHTHRRISWPALFAGVFVAIAVLLLLSLLGAGVGLGTVDMNAGSTPTASSLGIGAVVWWFVTSSIALFVGGYVAAWLAGIETHLDGMLHGVVTWGIASLVLVWLLTSAIGGLIGGGFSALSGVVSATGSGVSQIAKPIAQAAGVSPDMIQQQAQAFLQPANSDPAAMSPQDALKEIGTNLVTYERGGADAPAAKERIIVIIAAQRKISHDEAAKQFNDIQAKLTHTRNQAVETAKNAADSSAAAASTIALVGFGVLLLNLIAAAIGGSIAVQRRLLVTHRTVDGRAV